MKPLLILWIALFALPFSSAQAQDDPLNTLQNDPPDYAAAALPVSCRVLREATGHIGPISSIAYSPDGKYMATGGFDGLVTLRQSATGRILHTFFFAPQEVIILGPDRGVQVQFTDDGKRLVGNVSIHQFALWDVRTGQQKSFDLENKIVRPPSTSGPFRGTNIPRTISTIAFSPNGKQAALMGQRHLEIWDTRSHKLLHEISIEYTPGDPMQLRFSADNETLIMSHAGGLVICNTRSGQIQHSIKYQKASSVNAQISPDSRWVAVSLWDSSIGIWDIATGKLKHTLPTDTNMLTVLAFSPDGSSLVTANASDQFFLWDVESGQNTRIINKPFVAQPGLTPRGIRCLAFSPNGKTLAEGNNDPVLLRWDTTTWQSQKMPLHPEPRIISVATMAFSPDNNTFAIGDDNGNVEIWNMRQRRVLRTMKASDTSLLFVLFQHKGSLLTTMDNRSVKDWDVKTRRQTAALEARSGLDVYDTAISPDGIMVALGASETGPELREIRTGRAVRTMQSSGNFNRMAISTDNTLVAANNESHGATLWDAHTGKVRYRIDPNGFSQFLPVAFSPDGNLLAHRAPRFDLEYKMWNGALTKAYTPLEVVQLWNTHTGEKAAEWPGPFRGGMLYIEKLVFSPDGRLLALNSNQLNTLVVLDVTTGKLALLKGHTLRVYAFAFSPDSNTLVSADCGGGVRLWSLTAFKEQQISAGYH